MKKHLHLLLALFFLFFTRISNSQCIPVIIHVIHGGQATGTYPNLAQGQLNSQIQVLNDDHAGIGYNASTYPVNAFTTYATNPLVLAASKDGLGRIKIANTGITFCLALKDSLGNTLTEPGIDRIDYNSISAPLTGTFTSKNPAASAYNNLSKFQSFIDGYIKPNTIWNCSKYYNIWVTDIQASVGFFAFTTLPPGTPLSGLSGGLGTNKTDGTWIYAKTFGSFNIYPSGTYLAPYNLGRICTHSSGLYFGVLLTSTCPGSNDYCNDTPPGSNSTFATCSTTYPTAVGTCTSNPSNTPNGEMFMNFMESSDDCAMYMFTQDQTNRAQIAKTTSPYRKFLGTHGICAVSCVTGLQNSFKPESSCSLYPNPVNDKLKINSETTIESLVISDVFGKTVIRFDNINKKEIEISTLNLEAGVYFASINGAEGNKVKKFVKE